MRPLLQEPSKRDRLFKTQRNDTRGKPERAPACCNDERGLGPTASGLPAGATGLRAARGLGGAAASPASVHRRSSASVSGPGRPGPCRRLHPIRNCAMLVRTSTAPQTCCAGTQPCRTQTCTTARALRRAERAATDVGRPSGLLQIIDRVNDDEMNGPSPMPRATCSGRPRDSRVRRRRHSGLRIAA